MGNKNWHETGEKVLEVQKWAQINNTRDKKYGRDSFASLTFSCLSLGLKKQQLEMPPTKKKKGKLHFSILLYIQQLMKKPEFTLKPEDWHLWLQESRDKNFYFNIQSQIMSHPYFIHTDHTQNEHDCVHTQFFFTWRWWLWAISNNGFRSDSLYEKKIGEDLVFNNALPKSSTINTSRESKGQTKIA